MVGAGNFVLRKLSQLHFLPIVMTYFLRFRRFALLLLGLTLGTQAMAVASLGACHQVKALSAMQLTVGSHADQQSVADAVDMPHHRHDSHAHHGAAAHDTESNGNPGDVGSRVKCAACAGCHLCSVVLPAENVLADVLTTGSTAFPESAVARARNIASGLERPPRA